MAKRLKERYCKSLLLMSQHGILKQQQGILVFLEQSTRQKD